MSGRWLTPDEIHTAQLLRREGKTFGQIGRRLGRSREAIRDACKGLAHTVVHNVPSVGVPDHVLAEREQCLARQPRDLTAAIVGDPLPGRSALDRKMASVAAMRAKLACVRPST